MVQARSGNTWIRGPIRSTEFGHMVQSIVRMVQRLLMILIAHTRFVLYFQKDVQTRRLVTMTVKLFWMTALVCKKTFVAFVAVMASLKAHAIAMETDPMRDMIATAYA